MDKEIWSEQRRWSQREGQEVLREGEPWERSESTQQGEGQQEKKVLLCSDAWHEEKTYK